MNHEIFTDSKPVNDTGYTAVCLCGNRFGGPVFGERFISIRECPKCIESMNNAQHKNFTKNYELRRIRNRLR